MLLKVLAAKAIDDSGVIIPLEAPALSIKNLMASHSGVQSSGF